MIGRRPRKKPLQGKPFQILLLIRLPLNVSIKRVK